MVPAFSSAWNRRLQGLEPSYPLRGTGMKPAQRLCKNT